MSYVVKIGSRIVGPFPTALIAHDWLFRQPRPVDASVQPLECPDTSWLREGMPTRCRVCGSVSCGCAQQNQREQQEAWRGP